VILWQHSSDGGKTITLCSCTVMFVCLSELVMHALLLCKPQEVVTCKVYKRIIQCKSWGTPRLQADLKKEYLTQSVGQLKWQI